MTVKLDPGLCGPPEPPEHKIRPAEDQCELCGHVLSIGDWPFCPHEPTLKTPHFAAHWDEHVDEVPRYLTSPMDRFKYMDRNNLEVRTTTDEKRRKGTVTFFLGKQYE